MMLERFKNIVEGQKGLINDFWSAPSGMSSDRILLAVSGGIDSMCMADLFHEVFGKDSFAIAHCNFHLRGEESDGDESLVRAWAESRGIQVHFRSFDTVSYAEEMGMSIEMAARELRYRWFAEVCREGGYVAVAAAHHSDDNAETLLLNLVRGTGMKGLCGMKPVSPLPYCEDRICLMRPMLTFSRKQIEGYVFAGKVPYREDSSNASLDYRRNRIRHKVFPSLRKLNPSFVKTLNREMVYFTDAEGIVSEWCEAAAACVTERTGPDTIRVHLDRLTEKRHWRYLLFHILEPFAFNSSVLASLEDLVLSDRTFSGKTFSSATHLIRTGRGYFDIAPLRDMPAAVSLAVEREGTYECGGLSFSVEVLEWPSDIPLKQPKKIMLMDADRIHFPFVCREWRQGDWMIPLGMRGRKKVSDLFNDMKYDADMKKSAVLLAFDMDTPHIAGILGERIDDGCKVGPSTHKVMKITIRK